MNLLHFFVPHKKNNHRPKILHHTSLIVIIMTFAFLSSFGILINKTHPEVLGISYQISEQELLNLVNFEREKEGLPALSLNQKLSNAAYKKALNMFQNDYWAHFAPDGTTPWSFIKSVDYDYLYAGENLAKGYTSSYDTVSAWMNSPTHRDNITSSNYRDVGFAVVEGRLQGEDTVLIVQMFGSTYDGAADSVIAEKQAEASENYARVRDLAYTNSALGSSEGALNIGELKTNPMVDVIFGTKAIVFTILSILVVTLIIDLIIVEKNKIPRVVGNNLDHIILITLFIIFMFTNSIGDII